MDPNATKTSLLCTWIVKAMEHGESRFQLMLSYWLARFNMREGRVGDLALTSSLTNNAKVVQDLGYGNNIT